MSKELLVFEYVLSLFNLEFTPILPILDGFSAQFKGCIAEKVFLDGKVLKKLSISLFGKSKDQKALANTLLSTFSFIYNLDNYNFDVEKIAVVSPPTFKEKSADFFIWNANIDVLFYDNAL